MGELQERITSTKTRARSPRCRRSTCRPTTTPTRRPPRPSPTSTRRPTCRVRSSELGIYPAVDPLASSSRILDPRILGQEHYEVARSVKQMLQRYKDLQDIIAIMGIDELSRRGQGDRRSRARKHPEVPVPALPRRRAVHGHPRQVRSRSRTPSAASRRSSRASYDHLPEQAFYMVGPIEEVLENAEEARRARDVADSGPAARSLRLRGGDTPCGELVNEPGRRRPGPRGRVRLLRRAARPHPVPGHPRRWARSAYLQAGTYPALR